jgi:hypothetical protein
MKHGSFTALLRFPRTLAIVASAAAALFFPSPPANSQNKDQSIVIDREVLVQGLRGKPDAMARLMGGGFVIVGAWGTGWAAGTDANGKLLWKYEEPQDPLVRFQDQSEFHGVVALANGGALLCGKTSNRDHQAGIAYIVILNADGSVSERRRVYPDGDVNTSSAEFDSCFPWGSGFAIMGLENKDGNRGYSWLMRLDKNGNKVWEKTGGDVPGYGAVETADGSLVGLSSYGFGKGTEISRLNQNGDLVTRRTTGFIKATPVLSAKPNTSSQIIGEDGGFHEFLFGFDENLKDKGGNESVNAIYTRDGCAYSLPDGSVALFGNSTILGGAFRSAIGRVNQHRHVDNFVPMTVPASGDASFSVRSAIPLSAYQFVTMRDQVTSSLETSGVVLSWVTFK